MRERASLARVGTTASRRRPASAARRWLAGLAVTMVVAVPCMVVEEDWHGHAMIDLRTWLWIPFAVAVALAFVVGGAIATSGPARRRRGPARFATAVGLGLGCGLVAIVTLVACDLVRRFVVLREGLSFGVVELWIVAGAGAVVLGGIGGALGHALAHRRRPRLVCLQG